MLQAVALVGEFNNWDPQAEHWASRNNFGVWQLFLPDTSEGSAIPHRCNALHSCALTLYCTNVCMIWLMPA